MICKELKNIKNDYQYFKDHLYLYSREEKIQYLNDCKNRLNKLTAKTTVLHKPQKHFKKFSVYLN